MKVCTQLIVAVLIFSLVAVVPNSDSNAEETKSNGDSEMKPFRVALVQMLVEGGELESNLARAEARIATAAENGADVVLLPEAMDLGWTDPSSKTLAEPIPDGSVCQRLAAAAKKHKVFVCSGLTEKSRADVFNSAVLINPEGKVILKHRKLNELEIGHEFYAQGDHLRVAHTRLGTIGILICADATAKDRVLSRSLCYMGADVILSPSAWAMPADHDNDKEPYGDNWRKAYQPVAKEFGVWFLSASNVGRISGGPWAGQNCIGCSLVVDSGGEEKQMGPYGADADTILYQDVTPIKRPARGTQWRSYRGPE